GGGRVGLHPLDRGLRRRGLAPLAVLAAGLVAGLAALLSARDRLAVIGLLLRLVGLVLGQDRRVRRVAVDALPGAGGEGDRVVLQAHAVAPLGDDVLDLDVTLAAVAVHHQRAR